MATQQELWDGYSRLSTRLVNGTGEKLGNAFRNLGSWRDEDYQRFLKLADNTVSGAKLQAAKLQTGYYSEMAKIIDEPFKAVPMSQIDLSTPALRNGVTSAEVYRRPFVEVYTALAQGKQMTDAIEAGARRMTSIASTDVQLARREAGLQNRQNNERIVGYRRVLTGSENCALCYVASTQRYTKSDLLPIHPGCDCGEMPIYGTKDPGQVLDQYNLDKIHEAVDQRFGVSSRDARTAIDYRDIKVQQHGELGPVLTVRGQKFTTLGTEIGPILESGQFYLDEAIEVQYGPRAKRLAEDVYTSARGSEPAITEAMENIASANNAELSGLKFRLKTKDSLARKIAKDAEEKGISLSRAASEIGDSVRFTMVSTPANYARTVTDTLDDFRAQGFEVVKVKNYWLKDNGYMGMNVNMRSPDGQKLELQFHTPQSLKVKDPSHKLYDESRKLPDGPEKDRLVEESRKLWRDVVIPGGLDGIGIPTFQ
jgi:hypothetical protein